MPCLRPSVWSAALSIALGSLSAACSSHEPSAGEPVSTAPAESPMPASPEPSMPDGAAGGGTSGKGSFDARFAKIDVSFKLRGRTPVQVSQDVNFKWLGTVDVNALLGDFARIHPHEGRRGSVSVNDSQLQVSASRLAASAR